MLIQTLSGLICPECGPKKNADLTVLEASETVGDEIVYGQLQCKVCKAKFPILAGVALLVVDVPGYIQAHAIGLTRQVPEEKIPGIFRSAWLEECDDEDLEAERVNALYFINHYLDLKSRFWSKQSPLIDQIIRDNWERSPFHEIREILGDLRDAAIVEIGCGPGGLLTHLRGRAKFFLGLDNSFASIALARHLQLGAQYSAKIRIPQDLFSGPLSKEVPIQPLGKMDGSADFVVSDFRDLCARRKNWDCAIALNLIDMLDEPRALPRNQKELLKRDGIAIQSSPYIWQESAARELREISPAASDSAQAVRAIYESEGFQIENEISAIPWLFFKHFRQLEIYSVHLLKARIRSQSARATTDARSR